MVVPSVGEVSDPVSHVYMCVRVCGDSAVWCFLPVVASIKSMLASIGPWPLAFRLCPGSFSFDVPSGPHKLFWEALVR